MTNCLLVYMTARDRREARRIAETLIARRLCACVNILGAIESVYHWQGRVARGREIALIAKTPRRLFRRLEAAVREVHSYDTPCIVALPLAAGHAPFLRWIEAETQNQK